MKKNVLIFFFVILGAVNVYFYFTSSQQVFLQAKNCIQNKKITQAICSLSQDGKEKFQLVFEPIPKSKESLFQLSLVSNKAQKDLHKVSGELIGLSMQMPENKFDLALTDGNKYSGAISPGFCSERKMSWRLKINLVMSDKSEYYTFIDYTVESK